MIMTRSFSMPGKLPTIVLAIVHGVAGMTIFLLPISLCNNRSGKSGLRARWRGRRADWGGGLLLSFLKAGKPILSRETILKVLPGLLLLMTLCFVIGFRYR